MHAEIENHDMTCEIQELKRKKRRIPFLLFDTQMEQIWELFASMAELSWWNNEKETEAHPQFSPDHSKAKAELENAFLCKTSQEMQFLQAVVVVLE